MIFGLRIAWPEPNSPPSASHNLFSAETNAKSLSWQAAGKQKHDLGAIQSLLLRVEMNVIVSAKWWEEIPNGQLQPSCVISLLCALSITSAGSCPQVGAALGCCEPNSVSPLGLSHPSTTRVVFGRCVFSRDLKVLWFFFFVILFCLMDFLFLIQLKGSEIHALD